MPLYEHIFIARQDISPQQVESLTEDLKNIITSDGGTVAKTEYWGLRSLAYRIKKNRKGHYTLLNIDAPHRAVAEMERQMGINEDILRFLTIRVEEHESGDSVMMRNRGSRDGRDDRRPRFDRDDRRPRFDKPESSRENTKDTKPAEAQTETEPGKEQENKES